MDEQPPPVECYASRAMWHWVRCISFPSPTLFTWMPYIERLVRSRVIRGDKLTDFCYPARHIAKYSTASIVRSSTSKGCLRACLNLTLIAVDVPMSKVKFSVNTEYAYIQNFKVLQSSSTSLAQPFKSHALSPTSSAKA